MNRNQEQKEKKQTYVVPIIELFQTQSESALLRASFSGGHAEGQTADDGVDQGGGHGSGGVGEDTGDAKGRQLWDNYDEDNHE